MTSATPAELSPRVAVLGAALLGLAALCSAAPARAASYRLRGDALVRTQTESGLLRAYGASRALPWLRTEALVWADVGADSEADALVFLVEARHPGGLGELRGGRQIVGLGIIRPTHLDGLQATARAPWGTRLDLFGGVPVEPQLGADAGDWMVGGRLGQLVGELGELGASYQLRYDRGDLRDEEVGADLRAHPTAATVVSVRGAYDLVGFGFSEVVARAAWHGGNLSAELDASHRAPDLFLPATSIFSVLGAESSQLLGATLSWFAAPRLDLRARAGLRHVGGFGEDLTLRALLRLDDDGAGSVGVELRRQGTPDHAWSGVRVIGQVPLHERWRASTELEVAVPDEARGRGAVWPWGLVALTWLPAPSWRIAAGLEAGASPSQRYSVDGLLRATWLVDAI